MTPTYLIGIDIGTSGTKAALIDRHGKLLAWAGQEYPILTPHPGWAEQDPRDWLAAVRGCVQAVMEQAGVRPADVAAVGLAGQMHSLVCLDSAGEPLRPAILWADQRSAEQARQLTERIGTHNLGTWTGNSLAAGFMLASWVWLKEHEPQTAAAAHHLLLPKDYVRCWLTGTVGTEPSDASSTALFDPHLGVWSAPVLAEADLCAALLPEVFPSADEAGRLLPGPARELGLLPGTPVVYGCSDVSAQALAQGIVEPGTISCTIGTGGQLFAPLREPLHDAQLRLHLFCHCLPETWHQEAAILSAGLALRWLRDQIFPGSSYAGLADQAAGVEAALDGLFFLPFLTGERTPYMNPNLSAQFSGLRLHHGQAHLVRAVMEGVVFALRQGLDLMQSLGTPVQRLVATGGAARHPLWLQLLADVFNREVLVSTVRTVHSLDAVKARSADAARGAALLAGIGAGVYADAVQAIHEAVGEPAPGARPDPQRASRYAHAYHQYTAWADLLAQKMR